MPALRTTISLSQLLHSDLGVWTAEASSLGFKPGEWPYEIHVQLEFSTKVYKGPVPHYTGEGEDRELAFFEYFAPGSRLRIYND